MALELFSDKGSSTLALANNIKLAIAAAAFGHKFSPEPGTLTPFVLLIMMTLKRN